MNNQVLSVEQMQELERLGIDTNGGSMYWHNYNTDDDPRYELCSSANIGDIPTFTLQDILIRLPNVVIKNDIKYILILNTYHSYIAFTNSIWEGGKAFWFKDCSILDAAYKLLVWCLENKYI